MPRTVRAFVGATALVAVTLPAAVPAVADPGPDHSGGTSERHAQRLDQGTRALTGPVERRNAAKWPKGCTASGVATDAAGHIGTVGFSGPPLSWVWVGDESTMGFRPVAIGEVPIVDGSEASFHLATDDKGRLLAVEGYWEAPENDAVAVKEIQSSGWGDVTKIVGGYARPGGDFTFYADRGNGTIELYSAKGDRNSPWTVTKLSTLTAPDFSAAKFVAPAYPVGGKNSMSDVFVGVSEGRLMEWRVRHSRPGTMTSTVLQDKGWSNDTKIVNGRCFDGDQKPTGQRAMLAFTSSGRAHGFLDADGNDGKGGDITGLGMLGRGITPTVWPGTPY